MAGIGEAVISNYSFWHLEDVAVLTGHMGTIKLIEGCVMAAQCGGSSLIFYFYSENIINKFGYKHCVTFSFIMYAIRFWLIAVIPNPWWLVLIEFCLQGPTFSLMCSCIVAYGADIATAGTIATVQGCIFGLYESVGLLKKYIIFNILYSILFIHLKGFFLDH